MKPDVHSDLSPVSDSFGIGRVITGLIDDLEALRSGKISPNDAIARSQLAKQIFNGFRLYLNGAQFLAGMAVNVTSKNAIEADPGVETTGQEFPEATA